MVHFSSVSVQYKLSHTISFGPIEMNVISLRFFASSFSNTFLSLSFCRANGVNKKQPKKDCFGKIFLFSPLKWRISSQILHSAESVSLARYGRAIPLNRATAHAFRRLSSSSRLGLGPLVSLAARTSLRVASECVCVCVSAFYAIPSSSTGSSHEEKDDDEKKVGREKNVDYENGTSVQNIFRSSSIRYFRDQNVT